MKLYKYRSLNNFEFVMDILIKKRFHTALFTDLNDPMEGVFYYYYDSPKKLIDNIVDSKKNSLRVCSFSKGYRNFLLWSHYADGFKGICIELEIDENQCGAYEVIEIEYSNEPIIISNQEQRSAAVISRLLLSKKRKVWKYEGEVRTLSSSEYIDNGVSINRILLGGRISDNRKKDIQRVAPNLPLVKTTINKSGKVIIKRRRRCVRMKALRHPDAERR